MVGDQLGVISYDSQLSLLTKRGSQYYREWTTLRSTRNDVIDETTIVLRYCLNPRIKNVEKLNIFNFFITRKITAPNPKVAIQKNNCYPTSIIQNSSNCLQFWAY